MIEGERTATLNDDDLTSLEERARPFRALYEHWERTQWSVYAIDFSVDAESFARLDETQRNGLLWIFSHRFHAEFNVATLLAPFLNAAPDYEMQLLLATQTADEFRHLQCVLRVYEEVFKIRGGIEAVRALANQHMDPVAEHLYAGLDETIRALEHDRHPDAFLRAVMAYHLLAEGVVARTAQYLAGDQYERLGNFPGLSAGQRFVARDEARHIGIGVSYARRRLNDDPDHTREVIAQGLEDFAGYAARGLALANEDGLEPLVRDGYGVDIPTFYGEIMRLLDVRLRSIGFLED